MLEAVKVALDPTPVQERLMLSHAGAARFAYNAGLAHVKETIETGGKLEWTLYALRRWWNANKGTLAVDTDGTPWWRENSKEAYNSGLEALSDALSNWSKSRKGERKGRRVGFPRFKARDRETPRFAYTTGSFGLVRADPGAQTAAHRPRALHGERRRTRGRGQGAAHDGVVPCGTLARRVDRQTRRPNGETNAEGRGGRHRSGREILGDALGRHHDRQPAHAQGQ